MKQILSSSLIFTLVLLMSACGGSKKTTQTPTPPDTPETVTINVDEMEVLANKKRVYQETEKRVNDLLHTTLNVRFDWEKRHVIGTATMDFTPYFYPTSTLTLDAKGFDVNKVALVKNGNQIPLKFTYDDLFINIALDKEYKKGEEYTIFVDYVAKPDELEVGGSDAITSEKGLYFINPDGTEDKPQQIWTQGETEANSCWFPTIDSPNERCSQEINVTVQERFSTLSNGVMVNSKNNDDGTRTDTWKQQKAHAPYLFMLGIGEFSRVQDDRWNGKIVDYYVEPEYEPYAKEIFKNTPEMLTFYSEVLDYPYPWDKYSQIIVRDYVSGAMENTGAVIFGEFVQRTPREMLDGDSEDIVAHELFHHWFGDLVTCESWSNLPLNESFATYGEYIWFEHKYGREAGDYHIKKDLDAYLQEAKGEKKNLIRFNYDDKEDMFDAHSYQKGGRILHMLRKYVGDEAFFASLNKYLKDNEYTSVEIHNLRLAFEAITGEDLNWFFNQWFLSSGHPVLDINYDYDEENGEMTVSLNQTQDEDVFELPMAIDIYYDGDKKPQRENIIMTEREESFTFSVKENPKLVNVDAEKMLLCEKTDNRSIESYAYQFDNAPLFIDRYESMKFAAQNQNTDVAESIILKGLKDDYWALRATTINNMKFEDNPDFQEKTLGILRNIVKNDPDARVRSAAVAVLGGLESADMVQLFKGALKDSSYAVNGAALTALALADESEGLRAAKKYENTKNEEILRSVATVYGENGDDTQMSFFTKNIAEKGGFTRYTLAENFGKLLTNVNEKNLDKGVNILEDVALNDDTWWVRLSGARAINDIKTNLSAKKSALESGAVDNSENIEKLDGVIDNLTEVIKKIKTKEQHPRLKMLYMMMQ